MHHPAGRAARVLEWAATEAGAKPHPLDARSASCCCVHSSRDPSSPPQRLQQKLRMAKFPLHAISREAPVATITRSLKEM